LGVDSRMFEPPAPDLAKINARLAKLPMQLRLLIQGAGDSLGMGDLSAAQAALAKALALAPGQPDVLRLYGLLLARVGNLPAALANFEAAIRAAPDDAIGYWQYAQVLEQSGNVADALRLREQAVQRLPDSPMAWADLGEHLARHQRLDAALAPLERATRLAPDYAPARLKLGDALVSCGRAEEGAAAIRRAIAAEPAFGAAWLSLSDIKTVPVTDDEVDRMLELLRGRSLDQSERTAVEFALARAHEERGRHPEAFGLLVDANARRKREVGTWEATRFRNQTRLANQVFDAPHAEAEDPRQGEQAIFVVGMPRSGTTLVEQVLASHTSVQGAGELGELAQVLTEESARLKQRFPEWVSAATAPDWQRLGQRYLELTGRYRDGRAHFVDKMPNNWQALGAIRAMLPGARIVVCRRDPLENCWSCFKQYFTRGWEFTYDIDDLATFWKGFDQAASYWARRAPQRVREQRYEALTEAPGSEIRALLAFCGLTYENACLNFHESRRGVQTLSAAQVRQPMHKHRPTAAGYGPLLDPLRSALGLPVSAPAVDSRG
jgi:tetratricopeptide (TPR) repeat protein